MSWRVCCVIQRLGRAAKGYRVSNVGNFSAWDGSSCWGWCLWFSLERELKGVQTGLGGEVVVDVLSTSCAVGQRSPRYRRHPAQDLSASKGPPRSIAPRCGTTGSTPPPRRRRRLMTQLPAGVVHFDPSSSVLAPKVSPSHRKERRERKSQAELARLDNTAPPIQSRDEAMQDSRGDVRFEYRASSFGLASWRQGAWLVESGGCRVSARRS